MAAAHKGRNAALTVCSIAIALLTTACGQEMQIGGSQVIGSEFILSPRINNDDFSTRSTKVAMVTDFSRASAEIADMRFKNAGSAWSEWERFGRRKHWILPKGDGPKRVYVQLRTHSGLISRPYSDSIIVDSQKPSSQFKRGGNELYTKGTTVSLELSYDDNIRATAYMRFRAGDASWGRWEEFSRSKVWPLGRREGAARIYFQTKDGAGNKSDVSAATVVLDRTSPVVKLALPPLSSRISDLPTFPISWDGFDASAGTLAYHVKAKTEEDDDWRILAEGLADSSFAVEGEAGKTYQFRVCAEDPAGNTGCSEVESMIVPYDADSNIKEMVGFNESDQDSDAGYYLGTVKFSTTGEDRIVYEIDGNSVYLVSSEGPDRSRAKILIDGLHVRTVDAHASKPAYRKVVFWKKWSSRGVHTFEVVNLATPGRPRFDIDAIAIGR